MACRNLEKAEAARQRIMQEVPQGDVHVEHLDLADLKSVIAFSEAMKRKHAQIDLLINNAGVMIPPQSITKDGFELQFGTNHLGHFLLIQLLLERLKASNHPSKRIVILGTVTANSKELGGKIPIPAPADLGDLSGFEAGFKDPVSMASGQVFKPGKAYKDSKLCNMITTQELHRRIHEDTGISCTSLYPGCVADTPLFRNTPKAFQVIFPWFQKKITGGYVSQALAGERVAMVVANPEFCQSGVHWSWGNRQKKDGKQFSQELSDKATNPDVARRVWELSMKLVGL